MIEGKWYAKGSSKQQDALLFVEDGIYKLKIEDALLYTLELEYIQIASRLGNVERKLTLQDGSIFATYENDAIDAMFSQKEKKSNYLHYLESNIRWIIIALFVTIFSTFSFFKWGVPFLSEQIAEALPQKTNELIAGNTLEILDKYLFKATTIPEQEQEEIRNHFQSSIATLDTTTKNTKYKLHFRLWKEGNRSIPNAFALPSGDIIVTDKFIQLAKNQEEIDSILLHEMGHVVHKHTLKRVIESSFVAVAVMVIVGDTSAITDMGVGVGSLLVSSSYSRKYESEADNYAFEKMLRAKIDPASFSTIMNRMEASSQNKAKDSDEESVVDYISSHPSTKQRVQIAQKYSECFKRGRSDCDIVEDF